MLFGQQLPREEWGAPFVKVLREDGNWIVTGKKNTVTLNETNLAIKIQADSATWATVASSPEDMLVKHRGEEFTLRLADARKRVFEPYDTGFKTGVKIRLSRWQRVNVPYQGPALDLLLFLTVCLEGKDEELVFDVAAQEEETRIRQLDWPAALDAREIDCTLLPNIRGNLLPRHWPQEYSPIRTLKEGKVDPTDKSVVQSNVIECWSMSWWGFQKGKSAMMVIVETPDDAAYQFEHPAGGPTLIGPRWRVSLGRLGYPRTARFCFFKSGNYVDAPSYDPQFAIHEENDVSPSVAFPGSRFGLWKESAIPFMDHWDGGKQTFLNPRFMLGHLIKNYQLLFEHGICPQGSYLDVFGYVPPDEDFNPEHPATRTDCMRERIACYNWTRHHMGIVGTEAACDWVVPFADIFSPLGPGKCVPVPLFNLVYHDAIITTYNPDDLHGFLNGGLPQGGDLSNLNGETLRRIRRMAALHQRVALVEMTDHEFLDPKYRKERTTFADGTTVTVDWDTKTVDIVPEISIPGM